MALAEEAKVSAEHAKHVTADARQRDLDRQTEAETDAASRLERAERAGDEEVDQAARVARDAASAAYSLRRADARAEARRLR